MGPTWVLSAPDGPHVGPMNLAIGCIFLNQGYRERRAYIASQLPLPNTVVDLWRLLYDHKCSSISLLEQPNPDDKVKGKPI